MKSLKFLLVLFIGAVVTTSCGSMRGRGDCGLSKSLKIENIHDTKEGKIMLVDNQSIDRLKNNS